MYLTKIVKCNDSVAQSVDLLSKNSESSFKKSDLTKIRRESGSKQKQDRHFVVEVGRCKDRSGLPNGKRRNGKSINRQQGIGHDGERSGDPLRPSRTVGLVMRSLGAQTRRWGDCR